MVTQNKRQQRPKHWGGAGDHIPAKAKKGRLLEGAEKVAAIQCLQASKREKAEVARKVAVAAVKVERRIAQRLNGLDGRVSHSPRGLAGDPLAENDQRNELAAQIASRREENSERKLRQQEDRTAHADTACQRAWDNRLDVRPIIDREMALRGGSLDDDLDHLENILS